VTGLTQLSPVEVDRVRLAGLGLHPFRARTLVQRFGTAGRVLAAVVDGRIDVSPPAMAAARTPAEGLLDRLADLDGSIVLADSEAYPLALGLLDDRPDVLFVRGALPLQPGVAVVGTRSCTAYGRKLAHEFGRALGDAGLATISGLARGIDGEAHRGTVVAGGVGVAVLGSGIDVWYPREHRTLGLDLIGLGGAVISEYPPGTPPEGWRFPLRNRIIAGLSAATVVVEAGEMGGAQITAVAAAEQGRSVFAVPGDVDRPASMGTNQLIRDGAHPVLGPADLLELVGR
jgi:DNA processing protein